MMNEMATLMSKLEQQVAKAANKMSSRAEELKIRLNRQVEELLREGQDLEKHAEVNLTNLSSELRSRLENLAVDVQNNHFERIRRRQKPPQRPRRKRLTAS
jgi:hypothetical protein